MTGYDRAVANDPNLSPLSPEAWRVRISPGRTRPISLSLLSTRNSPLRDTARKPGIAASDDECSVGRIARRGAVASIRFRRRGRPLKGVGAGGADWPAKAEVWPPKTGRAADRCLSPKAERWLRAKRPSRDIAASRAA